MQATLGAATSASASATAGVNPPSAIPKHHRYSTSRSNSFSSASVVTVKRSASLSSSSGTGARNSSTVMRAQSPSDTSLIALRVGREPVSLDQNRRKSVVVDSTSPSNGEILSNSHRYSHSTSSSAASVGNTRRNRASSGALVAGFAGQSFSPQKKGAGTIDYSPRASLQRPSGSRSSSSQAQRSNTTSPERERRRPSRPELTNHLNSLPSLNTTPGLTHDTESPSTTQTVATPSTHVYGQDYFWHDDASLQNDPKSRKPPMNRSRTAPVSAMDSFGNQAGGGASEAFEVGAHSNGTREASKEPTEQPERSDLHESSSKTTSGKGSSKHKGRTRERGEKDKKSMLTKALEKANTAVLLDNAQNFEGALEAYLDACRLLQQVTERSSGTDDKRKLNAIKYTYTTRIEELRQLELSHPTISIEKSLPARPTSDDSIALSPMVASPTIDSTLKELPAVAPRLSGDTSTLPQVQRNRQSFISITSPASPKRERPLHAEPIAEK